MLSATLIPYPLPSDVATASLIRSLRASDFPFAAHEYRGQKGEGVT